MFIEMSKNNNNMYITNLMHRFNEIRLDRILTAYRQLFTHTYTSKKKRHRQYVKGDEGCVIVGSRTIIIREKYMMMMETFIQKVGMLGCTRKELTYRLSSLFVQ
jgi:hypothetical protein